MDQPTTPGAASNDNKVYQEATRLNFKQRTSSAELGLQSAELCRRCKNGHVFRQNDNSNVSVFCHVIGKYVPPDIIDCNRFTEIDELNIFDMTQMALEIDPKRPRDFGFTREIKS